MRTGARQHDKVPAVNTRVQSELQAELHSRGFRLTPQRQLVLAAVRELGHATPEQVLTAVQRKVVGFPISTVYRTLALLEELGLVRHAHLGHGASSFSPATEQEHVHLVCRDCGGVQELLAEMFGDLARQLVQQQGFLVDIGHTTLLGQCAACRGAAPAGP